MKTVYSSLLILIMLLVSNPAPLAHNLDRPHGDIKPEFQEPRKVIEVYLKAVERGELTVFNQVLGKAMLTPLHVEYVYALDSATPLIKVYSMLKQPIFVVGQENCKVRGVSSTLDSEGRIVSSEAHIWPEE